MGLKLTGVTPTVTRLRRIEQKTHKRVLRRARHGVNQIAKRARLYAPVDKGDLENAIRGIETRHGTFHGRAEWMVGVDPNRIHRDFDYAVEQHENYSPDAPNKKSSPKSYQKNESLKGTINGKVTLHNGNIVGGKYLERALEDFEDEIVKDIERIMKEVGL